MKYVLARTCDDEECQGMQFLTNEQDQQPLVFPTKKNAEICKQNMIEQELKDILEAAEKELQYRIVIIPEKEVLKNGL